ncbi:DUF1824 family protein [Prochlorococcus sp. MIT 1341]|uniref:DUF1824 family protein n=1 Tax=Prochlorococcus sp. MIT 1341 TaxID=3096221 RepID=UPI002A755FA8|nr:DUF1824 family protein [Prochlorococcus sp. MIT 1341]
MESIEVSSLEDLNHFRSAPTLDASQCESLIKELCKNMDESDWFTVGIMSPSSEIAISVLREIEKYFSWEEMKILEKPNKDGPVFLKANQKTRDIYLRVEYGLGEGVLITCQKEEYTNGVNTFGPFPLNFFKEVGHQNKIN